MNTSVIVIWIGLGFTSACQESETIGSSSAQQADAAKGSEASQEPKPKQTDGSQEEKSDFYDIAGTKPDEICGMKGFTYLFEGYILNECGTCHFRDNQFSVSEFAVKNDIAYSYEVMTTLVNKSVFIKATVENPFCNTCLLKQEDPLFKDLKYYIEHSTDVQCVESI